MMSLFCSSVLGHLGFPHSAGAAHLIFRVCLILTCAVVTPPPSFCWGLPSSSASSWPSLLTSWSSSGPQSLGFLAHQWVSHLQGLAEFFPFPNTSSLHIFVIFNTALVLAPGAAPGHPSEAPPSWQTESHWFPLISSDPKLSQNRGWYLRHTLLDLFLRSCGSCGGLASCGPDWAWPRVRAAGFGLFFFSVQVCGVTASFGFSEFCWSFTLLLHHSHLLDAVVQVVGEFPLQVGLVLLWLEDILLPLSVILCSLHLVLQIVHEPLTRGDVT